MKDLNYRFIIATFFFISLYALLSMLNGGGVELLTELTAGLTFELLKALNSDNFHLTYYSIYLSGNQYKIWSIFNEVFRVNIGDGCNGLAILLLYNWFLYSQLMSWKKTISFSLIGTVLLITLNVFRLVLLFYLSRSSTFWFDFMHKGVFQIGMYVAMAALWYLFLKEKRILY